MATSKTTNVVRASGTNHTPIDFSNILKGDNGAKKVENPSNIGLFISQKTLSLVLPLIETQTVSDTKHPGTDRHQLTSLSVSRAYMSTHHSPVAADRAAN